MWILGIYIGSCIASYAAGIIPSLVVKYKLRKENYLPTKKGGILKIYDYYEENNDMLDSSVIKWVAPFLPFFNLAYFISHFECWDAYTINSTIKDLKRDDVYKSRDSIQEQKVYNLIKEDKIYKALKSFDNNKVNSYSNMNNIQKLEFINERKNEIDKIDKSTLNSDEAYYDFYKLDKDVQIELLTRERDAIITRIENPKVKKIGKR